ncbi:MAG TPA: hypothetical protein VEA99_09100, partial [Gemmatimonadaceae bacterium]|nr:hypothetical protein [Gemmatimonadaceae bacterium]
MTDHDALDRRLDAVLQDLKGSYRVPRDAPLDAMWTRIDEAMGMPAARSGWRVPQWLGMAAALVIGVGLGRLSERPEAGRTSASPASLATSATDVAKPVRPRPTGPERRLAPTPPDDATRLAARVGGGAAPGATRVAEGEEDAEAPATTGNTDRYLGQTAALMVALANDAPRPGDDARFARRAR